MKMVRRSCTFCSACEGLRDSVPESSRKLRRRDLARRLSSNALSKCLLSLESEGVVEGRFVMPCSSNVGSLSSSYSDTR